MDARLTPDHNHVGHKQDPLYISLKITSVLLALSINENVELSLEILT